MAAVKKDFKLDIFALLSKIDKGDYGIWDKLSDEEKKGFAPLIVMRWMSGTDDARQIIFLNELVNPFVFTLGKHPSLLMKLLPTASSKQPKRYTWLSNKTGSSKNKLKIEAVCRYYGYSTTHAEEALPLLSGADILEMAEEMGYQKDELAKLRSECK